MSTVLAYEFARRLEECTLVPSLRRAYVARSFFLAARHPSDIDGVSYRWCPGTEHVIFEDMVSVPLSASTALQSAVLASVLFLSKSGGYRLVVVFLLGLYLLSDGVVVLLHSRTTCRLRARHGLRE